MESFDPSLCDVMTENIELGSQELMEAWRGIMGSDMVQQNILEPELIPEDLNQQLLDEPCVQGNIPSRDPYPGHFNFTLNLDEKMSGQQWVYSQIFDQLFIRMNSTLVMQFRVEPDFWAYMINRNLRFYIVALPVYSTDEHIDVPVNRCTFHSVEDDPQGQAHQNEDECNCGPANKYVGHVVRAGDDALYHFDKKTKRHSVRVLVTPPQAGSEFIRIPYTFACKTSCPKGMQRRPIHVIFTLEDEIGSTLGRQKIGVKICSCPKRDKKRQEDDYCNNSERLGSGNGKRKRPMPEMLDGFDSYFNMNNTLKNIKVETTDVQRCDAINEIKRELADIKRLHNEVKENIIQMENKFNRINELFESFL